MSRNPRLCLQWIAKKRLQERLEYAIHVKMPNAARKRAFLINAHNDVYMSYEHSDRIFRVGMGFKKIA